MKLAATIAQWIIRMAGLFMIIMGIVIWTGNTFVIPFHMVVGIILVLALWSLSFIALQSGVDKRLVILALFWGFLAPALGIAQGQILVGDAHVIVQVIHLLIGIGALAQGDGLAARIKFARAASAQATAPAFVTPTATTRRPKALRVILTVVVAPVLLLALGVITLGIFVQISTLPDAVNMSSTASMANMPGMSMPFSQPIPAGTIIPISDLKAADTATHTTAFTLTAEPATLNLGPNNSAVEAWTYNGTSPGPTLRVTQGDMVVITLTNHLPDSVTIHWHGVDVPNIADGVAGLTQDAIKPGESYTYRFIAKDAGTFWYHSHQFSLHETRKGLYGMFIVDPAAPAEHNDVDVPLTLHKWYLDGSTAGSSGDEVETINDTTGTFPVIAQPDQWVRLRIANTGGDGYVTLIGAPFTVAALDSYSLNAPTPLVAVPLTIGEGQRYDLRFQMPVTGAVELYTTSSSGKIQSGPSVAISATGKGITTDATADITTKPFDYTTYGSPLLASADSITEQSKFDVTYTMTLGYYIGPWDGRFGQVWTLNGQAFPNTPAFVVQPGQLVKVHIANTGTDTHTMHLHGHTFAVLSRNGQPLTGTPIYLDTLLVQSKETYDIAFLADNPGLWMFHCHNLYHANWGMDMMVVYPNISTPYNIGTQSGNFPD